MPATQRKTFVSRLEAYQFARDLLRKGSDVVLSGKIDGKRAEVQLEASVYNDKGGRYLVRIADFLVSTDFNEEIRAEYFDMDREELHRQIDDLSEQLEMAVHYSATLRNECGNLKKIAAREELMGAVWKYLATVEDAGIVDGFAVQHGEDRNLIVIHLSEAGDRVNLDDMREFFDEAYNADIIFFPNIFDEEWYEFCKSKEIV